MTGGAGFVGSHLVRALRQARVRVDAVDDLTTGHARNLPAGVGLIEGDVRDTGALREIVAGADLVFHLAAISSVVRCQQDLHHAHSVNLGGVVSVVEAVRDAAPGAPILFASSAAVYGMRQTLPIPETAALEPRSYYGLDKRGAEEALALACRTCGLRATALRLFNVYGPRQDPSSPYAGVISVFADRLGSGKPVTIYGDGAQTRDFIRAEDVADQFLCAARRARAQAAGTFEVFNVCTGTGTRIADVYRWIAELHGVTDRPVAGPARPEDIRQSVGDPARAIALLSPPKPVDFETGLRRYLTALEEPSPRDRMPLGQTDG